MSSLVQKYILLVVILLITILSTNLGDPKAAQASTPTPTGNPLHGLRAGDSIKGMTLKAIANQFDLYGMIPVVGFCNPDKSASTPATSQLECDVPTNLTNLYLAAELKTTSKDELEKRWNVAQWNLTLDGQTLDLSSFKTIDISFADSTYGRAWFIGLDRLTSGKHVYQVQQSYSITLGKNFSFNLSNSDLIYKINVGVDNFAVPCPPIVLKTVASLNSNPDQLDVLGPKGYLGVWQFKLSGCGAFVIKSFTSNSAAEQAGLKPEDWILGVDGVAVVNLPAMNIEGLGAPNETMAYTIYRDGKILTINVTLSSVVPVIPTPTPVPTATPDTF